MENQEWAIILLKLDFNPRVTIMLLFRSESWALTYRQNWDVSLHLELSSFHFKMSFNVASIKMDLNVLLRCLLWMKRSLSLNVKRPFNNLAVLFNCAWHQQSTGAAFNFTQLVFLSWTVQLLHCPSPWLVVLVRISAAVSQVVWFEAFES